MRLTNFFMIIVFGMSLSACVRVSESIPTPTQRILSPTPYPRITVEPPTQQVFDFPTLVLPTPKAPDLSGAFATQMVVSLDAKTKGAATEAAKQALAQTVGILPDQVVVLNVESVTWADTCMEIPTFTGCQPFGVAGYRVVLQANNQTFEYHTNIDGTALGLAITSP